MTEAPAPTGRAPATLLVVALGLTGLTMRVAATSVGAALDDLQRGLHVSGGVAGLITTLPVLCFAVMGASTPRLARRTGPHRLLTAALVASTAGLVLRPIGHSALWFTLLSVLALSGGAVANVLMPSLVKRHFPHRVGPMTALYTTALAIGSTAGAGLTVPIGDVHGGWRFGLGSWALLSALAVLPWLPTLRSDRPGGLAPHVATGDVATGAAGTSLRALSHSPAAWALTIFFAAQSMQAYIAFGWFARFLTGHGIGAATAGAMVALYSAIGIPVSAVTPRVPQRRQRVAIAGFCACTLLAYLGLALAPVGGAWLWMVLAGIGSGTFPMALTLIGLRTRTAAGTAALSAFVQVIGYVVAGTGPLLFGALFGATGSWALPLTVLFVAVSVTQLASWPATKARFVDAVDEPVSSA